MGEAYWFLLLAFIVAVNGFFAAAEVALAAARRSRIQQLAAGGNVGAQAGATLLSNPERLTSVVQLGVTLASIGLGWAGQNMTYAVLSRLLKPMLTPAAEPWLYVAAFILSFTLISFAHVVLGELVPRNLAMEKADRLAVTIAPVLLVFYRVAGPFAAGIERAASAISRLIGLTGEPHAGGHSPEELKHIINSSRRELNDFERGAMDRILDLGELYAREIMVPRREVVSVNANATLDQVLRLFLEHLYSRMPVYEGKPENIIGILHFKDLIRVWEERRLAQERRRPVQPFRLKRIVRKAVVVPETKPLNQLIIEFRANRSHIALVVDEFGTISGLVTLEDALEQVFGEFEDEHDEERTRPPAGTGVLEIDGSTPIRDLGKQWDIELPGDAGFETLAGFLLFQLGTIPAPGDTLEYGGRRFRIMDMERNRIARVQIEKLS